jgi:hypothetical protein
MSNRKVKEFFLGFKIVEAKPGKVKQTLNNLT